ncbi:dynein axonemal light chain 1-like [Sycon ciliatum]|uniref:dynein axonemal light chain 1-like n=1 Tax=Sycon ciliatum TaxID=27933 RepID=UPI0020AA9DB0|eukprot:scpid7771/ scgid26280/ Dynein light chain 1, axonemal
MPTSIKEAIARWQEKNPEEKADSAKKVSLIGQLPPIEKMDATLNTLVACEHLSLSSNAIEKIGSLGGLKNLKILTLSRNNIKSMAGLEAVGDTLEQLWFSYNNVEKLRGIATLKKLKILYFTNNKVTDWSEFMKLAELVSLEELNFLGNPLQERLGEGEGSEWREQVMQRLPKLKKLDGVPIVKTGGDEDE